MITVNAAQVYVPILQYPGLLREGDELLEVNGIQLMGRSTDEVIRLMVSVLLVLAFSCPFLLSFLWSISFYLVLAIKLHPI